MKTRDEDLAGVEVEMEEEAPKEMKTSFGAAVLHTPGLEGEDEDMFQDWDDEGLPENRWYKEPEIVEPLQVGEDGVTPIIPVYLMKNFKTGFFLGD